MVKYESCQLVLSEEYGGGMQIIPEPCRLLCPLPAPTLQSQVIKHGKTFDCAALSHITALLALYIFHIFLFFAKQNNLPSFHFISILCH